ncbi:hypothetical protein ACRALDRAFT_1092552, partial [Sodiomyces alcalophilus JCM 7366]|uniref:uncharacterized protein n=1 Tax=Sodiomyces alcalophilus JCM 7366 TaxID=591952 RepID=UPI0039B6A970
YTEAHRPATCIDRRVTANRNHLSPTPPRTPELPSHNAVNTSRLPVQASIHLISRLPLHSFISQRTGLVNSLVLQLLIPIITVRLHFLLVPSHRTEPLRTEPSQIANQLAAFILNSRQGAMQYLRRRRNKSTATMSPPRILVIGAGSRGHAYARAMTTSTNAVVAAIAEPLPFKRAHFGRTYVWGSDAEPQEGQAFASWEDFLKYETNRRQLAASRTSSHPAVPPGVDAVFICVLDEMHRDVVVGLAPLGLHIMCEKPLATNLADCLTIYDALSPPTTTSQVPTTDRNHRSPATSLFSVGHVLRYSPHNILLRRLLLHDRAIGDVLSIEHTEPVGWWHFAHSYVRGNWRRESSTAPSLLTKSCHDIDLLLWLLSAPPHAAPDDDDHAFHLPSTVSSTGSLLAYRKARKPAAAGTATNCMRCPLGDSGCKYSAKNIYLGPHLAGLAAGNTGWPIKIVLPEIEDMPNFGAAKQALEARLAEDYDASTTPDAEIAARPWFGRCVFEADNDVCDDQFVTLTWDDDETPTGQDDQGGSGTRGERRRLAKQATLHMVASTKKICERYSHIYGTDGEIYADSRTITVADFTTGETKTYHPKQEDAGHGGGDVGLARQFVTAVDKVKNEGWDVARAQAEFIGCSLDEVIRSHALIFAAEEARREGKVVRWAEWWGRVSSGG